MRFHGLEQKEHPRHLKDYLEALLRHAPSRSTCHFHIFKEPKGYLCKLTVHSNIKTFSSHYKDETMTDTVKTVLRNVKAQIASWKKSRSSLELTGVTSVTSLNLTALDAVDEQESENEQEEDYHFKKVA